MASIKRREAGMSSALSTKTRDKLRLAGRLGGLQTLLRHGRSHFAAIGARGGRPRLPEIEALLSQQASLREEELNKRRNRLPGGESYRALRERLKYHIDTGGLSPCGGAGSREGGF